MIIGVDDYAQVEGIADLRFAKSDARLMADTLVRSGKLKPNDVTIFLDEKATRDSVQGFLKVLVKDSKEEDLMIVYFAGQGLAADVSDPKLQSGAKGQHRGVGTMVEFDKIRKSGGGWVLSPDIENVNEVAAKRPLTEEARKDEITISALLSFCEVEEILDTCAGSVLVISDCCFVTAKNWKQLMVGSTGQTSVSSDVNRIFIGNSGLAYEGSSTGGAVLTFALARGLAGAADALTPLLFGEEGEGAPDGLVTLRELAAFIQLQADSTFRELVEMPLHGQVKLAIAIQGCVGPEKVVTRSGLPVE